MHKKRSNSFTETKEIILQIKKYLFAKLQVLYCYKKIQKLYFAPKKHEKYKVVPSFTSFSAKMALNQYLTNPYQHICTSELSHIEHQTH